MAFFISNANAQAAAQQANLFDMLWPMLLIFGAFWFFLIRPQQKKQKAHRELVNNVAVGDEILTAGGILGRITGVSEHYAVLSISDDTEIKIQKSSISQVVPKGTIEQA